jgi:hypothetical protein
LGHEFVGIEISNEGRRYEIAVASILKAKPGVWPEPVERGAARGDRKSREMGIEGHGQA